VREKIAEQIARRALAESVQVQLILDSVQAAPQPTHHLRPQSGALKGERFTADLHIRGDQGHDLIEIVRAGGGLARPRTALERGCPKRRRRGRRRECGLGQGLHVANRRAKLRVGRRVWFGAEVCQMFFAHGASILIGYRGFQRYSIVRTATPASAAQAVNQ
jgi:hypothetical protein